MAAQQRPGRLYYLIGPSGVGKDTLLRALAADAAQNSGLRIAQRHITRPPDPRGEQNIELSEAEFTRRESNGEFLFSWQSHGNRYAVGAELLSWLQAGDDVVVNGSRQYLEAARQICPALIVVRMTVDDAILRRRLTARGRESSADIELRIARNHRLEQLDLDQARIDNNGSIDAALAQFQALRA